MPRVVKTVEPPEPPDSTLLIGEQICTTKKFLVVSTKVEQCLYLAILFLGIYPREM